MGGYRAGGIAVLHGLWLIAAVAFAADTPPDVTTLYEEHCLACHGAGRLGGTGPALLPQTLGRSSIENAVQVIAEGRAATQMPAFGKQLSPQEMNALAQWILTEPAREPQWTLDDMRATHRVEADVPKPEDTPVFRADPLNLFVVVETGDHHVTVLDGDQFEPLTRFATHRALHGGPKFSPDGRFVYFASRDGWITQYDLYRLRPVADIRVGINTRNAAVSSDGRYVMVGNYLPQTLVVLDAHGLAPVRVIPVDDGKGTRARVSAVYDAPPRHSFVVALKDIPELWEVPYRDDHEPIYSGLVHDYRSGEALAEPGPFPVRRIRLDDFLDDFFFTPDYDNLIGAARDAGEAQVINLIVGRKIAAVPLPGLPHLGSGISWEWQGRRVLATPNLKQGLITFIDMRDWSVIKEIETLGPGFFLRSHERSPYAWSDVFFGPNRDVMHVIDKEKLEIVRTLRPMPGKTSAHVEFTRDGRYALLSIWEDDGALIIYDGRTLKEVKRLPMRKPSGKYNVYNKISGSEGTSH